MGVGVFRVPVVNGDPVETGAQVALHLPHQIPRIRLEVAQFGRVLRRQNESELMPVLASTGFEVLGIDHIG